jgi:formylglycine-generating enzyme required for sulfatase activity
VVVVPVGEFLMGSPENEPGRKSAEGPQRTVRFETGFAIGQGELTVGEFALFVEDTGYSTEAEREGWSSIYDQRSGRVSRRNGVSWRNDFSGRAAKSTFPVLHLSWNDAQAYLRWLSGQTGQRYRLPTEAEFEYALRAGSTTRYWWGDGTPSQLVENLTGENDQSSTDRRWNRAFAGYTDRFWGPAPVKSFKPNAFGLYDLAGNVAEWVEDCWHDSYARAPRGPEAWVNPGCELRVVRGGSWGSAPDDVRSAHRQAVSPTGRGPRTGFRVVRELSLQAPASTEPVAD